MNQRHRRAQYASRASVLLNTFMMVKERPEPCLPAIIIGIRSNGIQVGFANINNISHSPFHRQAMIPKFGLETVIYLNGGEQQQTSGKQSGRNGGPRRTVEQMTEFCAANGIRLFQEVKVSLAIAERKDQRKRIDVRLVEPRIEGFSIVTDCETELPS